MPVTGRATGTSEYSDGEIEALGKWLKDGLSATQLADKFTAAFRFVTRNAMIGIVARNKILKAIGFARGGRSQGGGRKQHPRDRPQPKPAPSIATAGGGHRKIVGPGFLMARDFIQTVGEVERDLEAQFAYPVKLHGTHFGQVRSIEDMIAGRHAPLPDNAAPRPLAELSSGECRFPAGGDGLSTLFCASAVEDWAPHICGGSYCRFHRALTTRAA